jgi:hypothetical protein
MTRPRRHADTVVGHLDTQLAKAVFFAKHRNIEEYLAADVCEFYRV